jgi:hypothetical protein
MSDVFDGTDDAKMAIRAAVQYLLKESSGSDRGDIVREIIEIVKEVVRGSPSPGYALHESRKARRPAGPKRRVSQRRICERATKAPPVAICYRCLRQSPIVGAVLHFAPSGAPPPGQKTDTSASVASQLTTPSA